VIAPAVIGHRVRHDLRRLGVAHPATKRDRWLHFIDRESTTRGLPDAEHSVTLADGRGRSGASAFTTTAGERVESHLVSGKQIVIRSGAVLDRRTGATAALDLKAAGWRADARAG